MLIYSPERPDISIDTISVFLAGTIDMGNSINWQEVLFNQIYEKQSEVVVFNPRRKDWDSSWAQRINNPKFNEQVNWEMDYLTLCTVAAFNFEPDSQSPITMMELGNRLETSKNNPFKFNVVYCPDSFWRKGNVDILCHRYGVEVFTDKTAFFEAILNKLKLASKAA